MSIATLIGAADAIFIAGFIIGMKFGKACSEPAPRNLPPASMPAAPRGARLPHANPLDDLVATVNRKETAK